MPSSSYIAQVKSTIESLIPGVTLKEFTNQRAGETAPAGGAAAHPSIDDDMLELAIKLSIAEIEEILGDGETGDWLHVKLCAELSLLDIGNKWAIRMDDIVIADRDSILNRATKLAKRRVKSKPRVHKDEKKTGWKAPPSNFNPFDEVD